MAQRLFRHFVLEERGKANAEKRTIDLAFSSEFPVTRMDEDEEEFEEILSHDPEDVDLSRLKDGAPLLDMHDLGRQIGVIEDAEVSGDKKGRARARFSKSKLAQEIFEDVQDGVRKHVSVGYEITRAISTETKDGKRAIRFAWMPYEISIVSAPEDPNTGIGRAITVPIHQQTAVDDKELTKRTHEPMKILLEPGTAGAGGGGAAAAAPSAVEVENKSRDAERKRAKAIRDVTETIAKNFPDQVEKFRSLANAAIDEGKSSEDFNAELLKALPGVRPVRTINAESLGMSRRDINDYSFGRGIQSMLRNKGRIDGLEGEVHDEMCKRNIGVAPDGFWVPPDVMVATGTRGRKARRDLTVGTFAQGGAMVQTTIQTPIIELLRNRMVTTRLGAQPMSGLEGNVAIPRQTGAASAVALPETATLTKSTQALDQVSLTPNRVGAWNDYSKQLLLQSSVDVENFVRDDLLKVLAVKWDFLILQGQGANSEPTGIMNTPGIGSVQFAGAATWSKIIAFETQLALANADAGNMAYVTTPSVRASLKAAAKIGSTFPVFIWEQGMWGDDSNDGEVNGYRAAATNQILNNAVAFGNWEDVIGPALWGGYDVVVNPYSRDTDGVVRVTVNTYGDVAVRHAGSFCWSSDAGNQ